MNEPVNSYEQERRGKLQKLRELNQDPYGHAEPAVRSLALIKSQYLHEMGHDGGPVVTAAGRVVLKRDMGKLTFITLRDESGDLQIAVDKKRVDETAWQINSLIDLGDQIVVEGPLGVTKKGEITVWSTTVRMAAKSLLPPPGKWDGLADLELRYRQRYVDLWANPEVMKTMKLRMQIIQEIRSYLNARGFLEVETPMMQPMAGGAAARPFTTHHNALDIPLFLRIAPELYLKRLLVGGFTKVFELNRNFRNEGISPRHNPEFTMLEAYEAFGSWETMADLVEGMICHIAEKLFGGLRIVHRRDAETQREINLERPWRRATMVELVDEKTGWKFDQTQGLLPENFGLIADAFAADFSEKFMRTQKELFNTPQPMHLRLPGESGPDHMKRMVGDVGFAAMQKDAVEYAKRVFALSPAEQLQELYEKLVEPTLINPCFVTQVPSVIIPLAKKNAADPFFADVYELAINGQEISPGYSELNDPDVQAANFATQVGDEAEKQKTDDGFLTALKYGMPPAGGIGLGIDRLVMMLTGAESIRDVILFPLMKPA